MRADESERLQEITAALSLAASRGDVGDTCLMHALRFVGAEAGFVVLTGSGGTSVQMISSEGYADDALEAWSALGLDAGVPFARQAYTPLSGRTRRSSGTTFAVGKPSSRPRPSP